jgi:hypothetical protein
LAGWLILSWQYFFYRWEFCILPVEKTSQNNQVHAIAERAEQFNPNKGQ